MAPNDFDEYGGTARFQVSPATVTFTRGFEALGCVQQTPKGALRWIARCCDTPVGLTLHKPTVPFVGLDLARVELDFPVDEVLGPLRARVNGPYPRSNASAIKGNWGSLLSMLGHLAPLSWRWWRAGDHHHNPFFSDAGAPIVDVEYLYDAPPTLLRAAGCR